MGLLGGISLACFVGAETMGLPCEEDADCGPKLTCDASGCCGGPCSGGTSPTTSSGTDPGSSTSTSPSTSTTDPATEGSDDTGPFPSCGDGEMNQPAEECDAGGEFNGEGEWPVCLVDCMRPPFYWVGAAENPADNDQWCPGAETSCEPWDADDGWWASGMYFEGPTMCTAPKYRLVSDWFEVPAPRDGLQPTLSVLHEWNFNVCDGDYFDGGRVMLESEEEGLAQQVLPFDEDSNERPLTCESSSCSAFCEACGEDPELTPDLYFVGEQAGRVSTERQLGPEMAGRARLIFEVGYDCYNCMNSTAESHAWKIHEVHVGFKGTPAD